MKRKNIRINHIVIVFFIIFICLFAVFPFLWMISTSFKPNREVYMIPPRFIPKEPTLDGYMAMLTSKSKNFNMLLWAKNSIIVSSLTTLFSLSIASLGGYGLSRFKFKGRTALGYILIVTQVLPGSLLIVPLYIIFTKLHLINTLIVLILAYTTFAVPFCTWTMKGYFDTIPRSLDEAAYVDGCSRFKTFFTIVLPLTAPGLIATGLFSFIAGWNEFQFASIFIQRYGKWTLPVGISTSVGQYSTNWTNIMAGAVMITVPIVLLFLFLQKHLVSGMTAGAVKQ